MRWEDIRSMLVHTLMAPKPVVHKQTFLAALQSSGTRVENTYKYVESGGVGTKCPASCTPAVLELESVRSLYGRGLV